MFAHRHDDLLLALSPVKITALGITRPGIAQHGQAVQVLHTRLQDDVAIGDADEADLDFFGDANIQSAQFVDDLDEGVEVNLGVVIDRHAQELLNGLNRQAGAAAREFVDFTQVVGRVDLGVVETGDIDPHIARDREHAGRLGQRVQGQHHHGVSPGDFAGFPITVIQAHHQDVDPANAVPGLRFGPIHGLQRFGHGGAIDLRRYGGGAVRTALRRTGQVGQGPGGYQVANNDECQNPCDDCYRPEGNQQPYRQAVKPFATRSGHTKI